MTNPRYDKKLNHAKGLSSGTQAAIVAAVTSLLVVLSKLVLPDMSEPDRMTMCSSIAVIGSAIVAAYVTMRYNRIKHGG